jgi:hypothetical protein
MGALHSHGYRPGCAGPELGMFIGQAVLPIQLKWLFDQRLGRDSVLCAQSRKILRKEFLAQSAKDNPREPKEPTGDAFF